MVKGNLITDAQGAGKFIKLCFKVLKAILCCLVAKLCLIFATPWTEGPGGLQSRGSLGVGHD